MCHSSVAVIVVSVEDGSAVRFQSNTSLTPGTEIIPQSWSNKRLSFSLCLLLFSEVSRTLSD